MESGRIAAIEGGGTSFVAAIAELSAPTTVSERYEVRTTSPEETLTDLFEWLDARKPFVGLGIASFGPIDPDTESQTFGFITTTPKPGWANTDVVGFFRRRWADTCPPIHFDTDVNAAALSEFRSGGHEQPERPLRTCAYVTVGTGIGVGLVVEEKPVHGVLHPELGHMFVKRNSNDTFDGACPFHGDCLEGLIATGSLAQRLSLSDRDELARLSDTHELWETVAEYLAQLCATLTLALAPNVIVLGGGVLQRSLLFPATRAKLKTLLNGYVKAPTVSSDEALSRYVVPSRFGNDAGVVGALELARLAATSS